MKLHFHESTSDFFWNLWNWIWITCRGRTGWVPSPHAIKLLLEPVSLYLWLLDPLAVQREVHGSCIRIWIAFMLRKMQPPSNECILLIFRHCICASVGDCPHPTFCRHCKDTSTHERFVILGLLILTHFPLESCQILHWVFLFPLHLPLCSGEHE